MREVGDTASSHQKAMSVPKSYNRVLTDTNINQKKKEVRKEQTGKPRAKNMGNTRQAGTGHSPRYWEHQHKPQQQNLLNEHLMFRDKSHPDAV